MRLGELGHFERLKAEQAIYHKDLHRVVYVYAEPVGRAPAAVAADVAADLVDPGALTVEETEPRSLARRSYFSNGGGEPWAMPSGIEIEWLGEGELEITRDVFRDLGIAFAAALLGIYALLIYQTGSYAMPLILMISIPLTLIGIMPGFWALSVFTGEEIGGFSNPTFFTATAMIGMIALSGIAVRNAILLIEFLHVELRRGSAPREAILIAGAVRIRPILLTAGTAMLAAVPITFDPIFSGLAWALIFGLLVSTAFTLLVEEVTQASVEWVSGDVVSARHTTVAARVLARIEEVYVRAGSAVRKGDLRVEAPVRESLAVDLAVGQSLSIELPALADVFEGRIDEIVPFAERGSRTLLVKVGLPRTSDRLFAGMFARVAIPAGQRIRLLVSEKAIVRIGQLEFATVVNAAGESERRLVTTGSLSIDGRVEVLSGLARGERVYLPHIPAKSVTEAPG